jgi:hypothetical protein
MKNPAQEQLTQAREGSAASPWFKINQEISGMGVTQPWGTVISTGSDTSHHRAKRPPPVHNGYGHFEDSP